MCHTLRLDKGTEIIVLTMLYTLIYFSSKLYSQSKDKLCSTMHCIEDLINSILSCRTVIHNENEHERDQSKYHYYFPFIYASVRAHLVYITQVNSTFRTCWLASSEVISQVLFTSEQPKKNKMAFVGILYIYLHFGE